MIGIFGPRMLVVRMRSSWKRPVRGEFGLCVPKIVYVAGGEGRSLSLFYGLSGARWGRPTEFPFISLFFPRPTPTGVHPLACAAGSHLSGEGSVPRPPAGGRPWAGSHPCP